MHFLEVGEFVHACEGDLVCKSVNEKVPYFNAPIYFENKAQVGKVDEIFGQVSNHVSFCCKLWLLSQLNCYMNRKLIEICKDNIY